MIVVSNTSPINYLILIGEIGALPVLFDAVIVPEAVVGELSDEGAPVLVREWAATLPNWVEVRATQSSLEDDELGAGEREAIVLAQALQADVVLLDDYAARTEAQARGLKVTGTLGILADAGASGILDLPDALRRLQGTNFRARRGLIESLLGV